MGYSDSNYSDDGSNYLERRDLLSDIISSRQIIRDGNILINKSFLDEVIDRCMNEGRNRTAISFISRLTAVIPSDSDLWYKRARCYLGLKEFHKAAIAIKKALKVDSANIDYLLAGGMALLSSGSYDGAEELFQRVIAIDRCDSYMYCQIGNIYSKAGYPREAVEYFNKAMVYNENNPDVLFQLALNYELAKDYRQSLVEYDRYLFIESNCAIGWFNRAIVLERLNRLAEAVESYQFALSLQEDFSEALMNLGNLYAVLNKPDEAVKCFLRFLDYQPGNTAVLFNLGALFEELKDFSSAVLYYTKSLEEKPDFQSGFLGRGFCYLKLDRLEDALSDFRSAFLLDLPIISRLKYDDGKLHKLMPKILRRIKFYSEKAAEDRDKYLPKLVTYYILAKKYNDAIAAVRQYCSGTRHRILSYLLLARIYFSMGNSLIGYAALSQAASFGNRSIDLIKLYLPATSGSRLFINLFNFRKKSGN